MKRLTLATLLFLTISTHLRSQTIAANEDPVAAAKPFVSKGFLSIPGANVRLKLPSVSTPSAKFPARTELQEKLSSALFPDLIVGEGLPKTGGYVSVWTTGRKIKPDELEQFVKEWARTRNEMLGKIHKLEPWTNSRSVKFIIATLDSYGIQHPVKHYHFVNAEGFVCFVFANPFTDESDSILKETIDTLEIAGKSTDR